MNPARWWERSRRAYRAGHTRRARWYKAAVFVVCHAVLPFEVEVGPGLRFYHRGLGVVIHPNTVIGENVTIAHGVTVAVAGRGNGWVVIGPDVHVGAGAILMSTGDDVLTIGAGASIGAGALVFEDVPPDARVFAPAPHVVGPARGDGWIVADHPH